MKFTLSVKSLPGAGKRKKINRESGGPKKKEKRKKRKKEKKGGGEWCPFNSLLSLLTWKGGRGRGRNVELQGERKGRGGKREVKSSTFLPRLSHLPVRRGRKEKGVTSEKKGKKGRGEGGQSHLDLDCDFFWKEKRGSHAAGGERRGREANFTSFLSKERKVHKGGEWEGTIFPSVSTGRKKKKKRRNSTGPPSCLRVKKEKKRGEKRISLGKKWKREGKGTVI